MVKLGQNGKKRYNQIIGKKGANGHICRMVNLGQMVVKWSRNGGKMVYLGKLGRSKSAF